MIGFEILVRLRNDHSPAPPIVFAVVEKVWKKLKGGAEVWKVCSQWNSLQVFNKYVKLSHFLDAIASPSTYPCQWVSQWVSDSFRLEIAIASPSFASLFN